MREVALNYGQRNINPTSFLNQASKYPLLMREEEQRLALESQNNNSIQATKTLVTSHLRLVIKIALNYRGYGLPVADLISEGTVGLLKAIKKFNPGHTSRTTFSRMIP